jgi:Bacteriophage clamp loader A subunit
MSFKPWDYFNDVTNNKKEMIRNSDNPELAEKYYEPWIVNKALSYFPDTVFYANEMNKYHQLSKMQQYDYFSKSINKRFRKYPKTKKEQVDQDLKNVMEYFKYSYKKAEEALSVLTSEQLQTIKQKLELGG